MVELQNMETLLKELAFFQEFDESTVALLAGCASNVVFEAGSYVARAHDEANKFFFLRHGDVALELDVPTRDPLVVETLHPGDALGWSWITAPHRWSFDARAVTLVRALAFDATCLRGKMDANHEVGYQLMRRFIPVIAKRLEGARLQLADLYAAEARS
ncbi:MAG: Crp/Fnr family transcriptional regulator [Hyphomicrobiales bacterium]|nr:MAG: Crp/Fnr family transcriptional regulator [Hyphomicrobiales bacterium]